MSREVGFIMASRSAFRRWCVSAVSGRWHDTTSASRSTRSRGASSAPASVTKAIAPQDNRPGWYTFGVIPTRVGTYRLNITGNLAGTSIAFDVALDNVAASSDVEFPVANPTPGDVQNQLSQMSAQIAALQAQLTLVLAVAAISAVVALIGVAASVMLLRRGSAKP